MQMRTAIALGALLTLAACGDDQTAKAPDNSNSSTAQTTGSDSASTGAAPQATTTAPATPAPSTSTATAPTGSAAPSGSAGSTATSGSAQNSGAAATATNSAGTSGATQTSMPPGATPIDSADDLKGRNFSAGRLSLQFPDSQRFVMTDTQTNDRIEGNYRVDNGALVLSDPTGDAATATFPMRCEIQSSAADAFQLTDTDGSCAKLKDQSFKTAGG